MSKKYIVGSKHKCQDKSCFIYFYTTGLGVTFDLVVFLHCILRKCLFVPPGTNKAHLVQKRLELGSKCLISFRYLFVQFKYPKNQILLFNVVVCTINIVGFQ